MLRQLKWISVGQLTNFLVPLMLMPVLARRLGPIGFASFAVLTGIAQYATLGVELGLNYIGLSEIKRASSLRAQRAIFSEIFYLKVILVLVVCGVLTAAIAASQLSRIVTTTTFACLLLGPLVSCIVCPVWYFTLKNRLDINFNIVLGSRLGLMTLCYLLIKSPSDYIKAVALFNFATLPFAAFYVSKWFPNLTSPRAIKHRAMLKRLWNGLQLSGAMLRETITNVGMAPLYGLFSFDSALGSFAFAEKLSKFLTMPAPVVTGALMASTPNEHKGIVLTGRFALVPVWFVPLMLLLAYSLGVFGIRWAVAMFFPQFCASIPLVYILASVSPIVYFNYIEVGMRYTKQGRFRLAAKMSYSYLAILFIASLLMAGKFGVWGLAVAISATEIFQMVLLINARKKNA